MMEINQFCYKRKQFVIIEILEIHAQRSLRDIGLYLPCVFVANDKGVELPFLYRKTWLEE